MPTPEREERWAEVRACCGQVNVDPPRQIRLLTLSVQAGGGHRESWQTSNGTVFHASLLVIHGCLQALRDFPWVMERPERPVRYDPVVVVRTMLDACIAADWWRLDRVLDVIIAVQDALDGEEYAAQIWHCLDRRLEGRGELLAVSSRKVYRRIGAPLVEAAVEPDAKPA